jgi:hypothetical protein
LHYSNENGNESNDFCERDRKCYHNVDTGRFAVTNIDSITGSAGYQYAISSTNTNIHKDRDLDSVRQCPEG